MADKKSGLGLGGYDAVSYFMEGRPRAGKFEYKTKVNGLTYCFFTQENLDKFVKKPDNFIPQFGGNCAFACGLYGGIKEGSPQIWKIVDGKLYLISNFMIAKLWEYMPFMIERGHSNYQSRKRKSA